MKKIAGVKFDGINQIFFYDAGNLRLHKNNPVIVRYNGNITYGTVISIIEQKSRNNNQKKLLSIVRLASYSDKKKYEANQQFKKYAIAIFKQTLKKYWIKLKLINAYVNFDRTKIIFYYVSNNQAKFKYFIRDLSYILKIKIELKPVGVRDEARIIPSIGICGRPLCCNKFLREFHDISIKMAKDQGTSLTAVKTSGSCGRLLCCLKYEEYMYEKLSRNAPEVDSIVQTLDGRAKVLSVNILQQTAKLIFDDASVKSYPFDKIQKVYTVNKINYKK